MLLLLPSPLSNLGHAVAELRPMLQLLPPPHHDLVVAEVLLLLLAVTAELTLQRLPASSSSQITHSLHVLLLSQNSLMIRLRTTMLLLVGLVGTVTATTATVAGATSQSSVCCCITTLAASTVPRLSSSLVENETFFFLGVDLGIDLGVDTLFYSELSFGLQ